MMRGMRAEWVGVAEGMVATEDGAVADAREGAWSGVRPLRNVAVERGLVDEVCLGRSIARRADHKLGRLRKRER